MIIKNVTGKIVAFDRNTCFGEVVYDLTVLRFHSTTFNSNRWPRVGERVEIAFSKNGEVLSLYPL
jgi:hypothetical protein